jgi:hypothetical protein
MAVVSCQVLEVDGDKALRLAGDRFYRFWKKGDGLIGIVQLGDGGFESGDDLSEGFALGAAAGFDAGEVGDSSEDEAALIDFGDVDEAVEDGGGPCGGHEAEAIVEEEGEWVMLRVPVK